MPRLLIIDDDEQLLDLMATWFTRRGYEVLTALDGRLGLECFACQQIDLVIADIVMPEKEGIETIIELRRLDPLIKIIAISGGGVAGPEGYLDWATKLGAARTLTKPLALVELEGMVRELMGAPS